MPQSRAAIDLAPRRATSARDAVGRKSMAAPPAARLAGRRAANLQSGRKISGQLGVPGAIRPRTDRRDEYGARPQPREMIGASKTRHRRSGAVRARASSSQVDEFLRRIYVVINARNCEAARTRYSARRLTISGNDCSAVRNK